MGAHDYDYSHKTEQEGTGMKMSAAYSLVCTTMSVCFTGKCGEVLLQVVSEEYQVTFPGFLEGGLSSLTSIWRHSGDPNCASFHIYLFSHSFIALFGVESTVPGHRTPGEFCHL